MGKGSLPRRSRHQSSVFGAGAGRLSSPRPSAQSCSEESSDFHESHRFPLADKEAPRSRFSRIRKIRQSPTHAQWAGMRAPSPPCVVFNGSDCARGAGALVFLVRSGPKSPTITRKETDSMESLATLNNCPVPLRRALHGGKDGYKMASSRVWTHGSAGLALCLCFLRLSFGLAALPSFSVRH